MTDESLQIFASEAEDLLGLAEQALLNLDDLDNEPDTLEGINDLFRTFHTIKGAAGLFGLDTIVDFTHIVENVLGATRAGSLTVDEEMVSLFLLSRDHLENLVESALGGTDGIDGELKQKDDELVERFPLTLAFAFCFRSDGNLGKYALIDKVSEILRCVILGVMHLKEQGSLAFNLIELALNCV